VENGGKERGGKKEKKKPKRDFSYSFSLATSKKNDIRAIGKAESWMF
jgi:hypothetical protein